MKGKIEESVPEFYGAAVVGERGQIVIPAKARRDMDITPGEKLIVLGGPQGNMLMMAKAEAMLQLLNKVMGHAAQFERMLQADGEPPK
jgi:AbrB family looped-hinge helix DNA binding protein